MPPNSGQNTDGRVDAGARLFADLLVEIWSVVQPLIGSITLSALLTSAVRQSASEHPLLKRLHISVDGIDVDAVVVCLSSAPPEEMERAMGEMLRHFLDLMEAIAGSILLKQVIPKIVRAEKNLPTLRGLSR